LLDVRIANFLETIGVTMVSKLQCTPIWKLADIPGLGQGGLRAIHDALTGIDMPPDWSTDEIPLYFD
jgi:hypothetical protein